MDRHLRPVVPRRAHRPAVAAVRVGIEGFGPLGRLVLRAGWGRPGLEFVQINEPATSAADAAYLLTVDRDHGRWNRFVSGGSGVIDIDGTELRYSRGETPEGARWADHGVQVMIDCSGEPATTASFEPYFSEGIKKVVTTHIVDDAVGPGVDDHLYHPDLHRVPSSGTIGSAIAAHVVTVGSNVGPVHEESTLSRAREFSHARALVELASLVSARLP